MAAFGVPRHHITHSHGFPRKISEPVLQVVVRAIEYAWQRILADPAMELETPSQSNPLEDVLSDAICNILEGLLHESPSPVLGFNSQVFVSVIRGEHLANYAGESINRKPDLVIRLAAPSPTTADRMVGIFIESKVVQPSTALGEYTDSGLLRFVKGDYAWTMQAALMLAYQRNGGRAFSALASRLRDTDHLGTRRDGTPEMVGGKLKPAPPLLTYRRDPVMVRSQHERSWTYTALNEAPGDIDIWHVWDLPVPHGY